LAIASAVPGRKRRGFLVKLVCYSSGDGFVPGALVDDGVVSFDDLVPMAPTSQGRMAALIDNWESLRPALEARVDAGDRLALGSVRIGPPLPRPGKILCCIGNYWEHAQREPRQLNMFLKNPDAVVGDGDVIRLPEFTEPWMFMHEAELAIVLRGPSKMIKADNWRDAVFGYTALIDVSARGEGRSTWKQGSWLGKSFDTFCPIGPAIATADEIDDPNDLHVQFWDDGQLRHNYVTDDMEHRVPELIQFASTIMTLNSGDLISCGTNHEGLGPLQDGERVRIEIYGIGAMELSVEDPLHRSWERGIYQGEDSTYHDAVVRHRPQDAHLLLPTTNT
jgi:2-keto-4-pentenoate hydratase/2-oxohepta-3-ene-1,7-dioic acid hydratase in catechol pathway